MRIHFFQIQASAQCTSDLAVFDCLKKYRLFLFHMFEPVFSHSITYHSPLFAQNISSSMFHLARRSFLLCFYVSNISIASHIMYVDHQCLLSYCSRTGVNEDKTQHYTLLLHMC